MDQSKSVGTWLKKRNQSFIQELFGSPQSLLITIAFVIMLFFPLKNALSWLIFEASWSGTTRADCQPSGACWVFIKERLPQFLVGFYPPGERWRCAVFAFVVSIMVILARKFKLFIVIAGAPLAFWLLYGGGPLPVVPMSQWGGFLITFILTFLGVLTALPLGFLLALGRRSTLPLMRVAATLCIEFWRSVPMVTVLFMGSVLLPLILPASFPVDQLVRAYLVVSMFTSAYLAEIIRGGLDHLAKGQWESSKALGLSTPQIYRYIVIPQIFPLITPSLVGTTIGLFKDTSLVQIIGMFDFLGMIQTATTSPEWLGYSLEGYVFAGIVYGVISFIISIVGRKLERKPWVVLT